MASELPKVKALRERYPDLNIEVMVAWGWEQLTRLRMPVPMLSSLVRRCLALRTPPTSLRSCAKLLTNAARHKHILL